MQEKKKKTEVFEEAVQKLANTIDQQLKGLKLDKEKLPEKTLISSKKNLFVNYGEVKGYSLDLEEKDLEVLYTKAAYNLAAVLGTVAKDINEKQRAALGTKLPEVITTLTEAINILNYCASQNNLTEGMCEVAKACNQLFAQGSQLIQEIKSDGNLSDSIPTLLVPIINSFLDDESKKQGGVKRIANEIVPGAVDILAQLCNIAERSYRIKVLSEELKTLVQAKNQDLSQLEKRNELRQKLIQVLPNHLQQEFLPEGLLDQQFLIQYQTKFNEYVSELEKTDFKELRTSQLTMEIVMCFDSVRGTFLDRFSKDFLPQILQLNSLITSLPASTPEEEVNLQLSELVIAPEIQGETQSEVIVSTDLEIDSSGLLSPEEKVLDPETVIKQQLHQTQLKLSQLIKLQDDARDLSQKVDELGRRIKEFNQNIDQITGKIAQLEPEVENLSIFSELQLQFEQELEKEPTTQSIEADKVAVLNQIEQINTLRDEISDDNLSADTVTNRSERIKFLGKEEAAIKNYLMLQQQEKGVLNIFSNTVTPYLTALAGWFDSGSPTPPAPPVNEYQKQKNEFLVKLNEKIADLNAKKINLDNQREDTKKLQKLTADINSIKAKISSSQEKLKTLDALKIQRDELEKQIPLFKAELEHKTRENAELNSKQNVLQKDIDKLKLTFMQLKSCVDEAGNQKQQPAVTPSSGVFASRVSAETLHNQLRDKKNALVAAKKTFLSYLPWTKEADKAKDNPNQRGGIKQAFVNYINKWSEYKNLKKDYNEIIKQNSKQEHKNQTTADANLAQKNSLPTVPSNMSFFSSPPPPTASTVSTNTQENLKNPNPQ